MVPGEAEAEERVVELEEMLVRPGTYFNPQTEVVVIVDDSATIDQEIFNMEPYEGADWVRISEDVPTDSDRLDGALEEFQTDYHPATSRGVSDTELEPSDDEPDDDEEEDSVGGRAPDDEA